MKGRLYQWAKYAFRQTAGRSRRVHRAGLALVHGYWKQIVAERLPERVRRLPPFANADRGSHVVVDGLRMPAGPALVVGGSRLVYAGQAACFNIAGASGRFLDALATYECSEEHVSHVYYSTARARVYGGPRKAGMELPGNWVSMCHPSANNWMHWLAECLPIAAAVATDPFLRGHGLVFDLGIPASARASLELVAGGVERVGLPRHVAARVRHLAPAPRGAEGWTLFWPRGGGKGLGLFHFDPAGLRLTRRLVLDALGVAPARRRKLFIRRDSSFRVMEDQDGLQRKLAGIGFEIVEPGTLGFREQVELFASAHTVVAQAGAALANLMFMPPGARVVCLVADSDHINFDYFADYARILGVDFVYERGSAVSGPRGDYMIRHPMNASFRIDWEALQRAIAAPARAGAAECMP